MDGEYAFPQCNLNPYGGAILGGMLLRDYLAAKALAAYISKSMGTKEQRAVWSYKEADAMLAERAKST